MAILNLEWTSWMVPVLAAGEPGNLGNYAIGGIAVVALLLIVMNMRGRRGVGRGEDPRDFAQRQIARLRESLHGDGGGESGSSILSLAEAQREINAQVDTKLQHLETVISDADSRIARLTQLIEQYDAGDLPRPGGANVQAAVVLALDEAGRSPEQIAEQLGRSVEEVRTILTSRPGGD